MFVFKEVVRRAGRAGFAAGVFVLLLGACLSDARAARESSRFARSRRAAETTSSSSSAASSARVTPAPRATQTQRTGSSARGISGSVVRGAHSGTSATATPRFTPIAYPQATPIATNDPDIPENIPQGDAAADAVTSRAVSKILATCADRYRSAKTFRASGTYIEAQKRTRNGKAQTENQAARMDIAFTRPNRLRVSLTGNEISVLFNADGTTVTQAWPAQRSYRVIPQPDGLAAFVDDERNGELVEDETNALVYSVMASLLATDDPLRWLHSNVKTYVYDGFESVNGRPCWRIKFLQTDPELVVVNWIDQETRLLKKCSVIIARDDDGNFSETFADASYGRIRVTVLDDMKVDQPVKDDVFAFAIPKGWHERPSSSENLKPFRQKPAEETAWSKLVRAASSETKNETTFGLTAEFGGEYLRLRNHFDMHQKVTALARTTGGAGGGGGARGGRGKMRLAAALSDGPIEILDFDGRVEKRIPIRQRCDMFAFAQDGNTSAGAGAGAASARVICADDYGAGIRAYDFEGHQVWKYERPGRTLSDIFVGGPKEASGAGTASDIFVGYLDTTGLRRVSASGKLLSASRRLTGISNIDGGDFGAGAGWRLVAAAGNEGGYFGADGRLISKYSSELGGNTRTGFLEIDSSDAGAPLIQVASAGEGEYVMRRARLDNSPAWTVPLVQAAKEIEPVGLVMVNFGKAAAGIATTTGTMSSARGSGRASACLLSDGRLVLVSAEGDVLWRGKVNIGGRISVADADHIAVALSAGDVNGDGADEIYVGASDYVLQIEAGG